MTNEDVSIAVELRKEGKTYKDIAEATGIPQQNLCDILCSNCHKELHSLAGKAIMDLINAD